MRKKKVVKTVAGDWKPLIHVNSSRLADYGLITHRFGGGYLIWMSPQIFYWRNYTGKPVPLEFKCDKEKS